MERKHWKRSHREGLIEEGNIWEASGRHLGFQEAMGLQDSRVRRVVLGVAFDVLY